MMTRLLLLFLLLPVTARSSEEAFKQYIQPILETRCVSCHGAERQKGGLRLDTREAALKGGDSGPALVPGDPSGSLLIESVSSHPDEDGHMPPKDESLTDRQKFLLSSWVKAGVPWVGVLVAREKANKIELVGSPFSTSDPVDLSKAETQAEASHYIDFLIDKALETKGRQPGAVTSDETFLRRAYLDIAGRIPTLEEYERYFSSETTDRRHALIDELLDSPGYVSNSHNYWLDALRAKERVGKNTFGPYQQWILEAIKKNMPFDQFTYELVAAEGRISDPKNGSAGYYLRDDNLGFMAEDSISNTMQLFLATDMLCAQCHDHPYKKWTQKDFYHLLAFIDGTLVKGTALNRSDTRYVVEQLKPETTPVKNGYFGYYKAIQRGTYKGGTGTVNLPPDYKYKDGRPDQLIEARVPFGEPVSIDYKKPKPNTDYHFIDHVKKDPGQDVRSRMHLAEWIASPENPMFTKTIVNRLWGRVFGSPLVGKNLDMSEEEMGGNPHLTAFLIEVMKRAKYDQKVFMKILYKTKSYQRTAVELENGQYYHPAPGIKRLTAEQIWDSLLAIRLKDPDKDVMTGTLDQRNVIFHEMSRMSQPERMEFIRNGKAARNAAYEKYDTVPQPALSTKVHRASIMRFDKISGTFLDIYGKSERGLIDGSVQEATIPQALHLMNNSLYMATKKHLRHTSFLYDRLKAGAKDPAEEKIKLIYNAILTRTPTPSEVSMATTHLSKGKQGFDHETLVWALTNSHEFKIKR